ncbi:MAG: 3D domain-containing protein, partial [Caulobacteraceae bacterium]
LVAPGEASSLGLHAWLAAHRGPEAEAVMCENPRYIFFRLLPDDGSEPRGASGARLVAGRSVAVDPRYSAYFQLLWIDAERPTLRGARSQYRRLVVALDTGSAIRGPVRADLYLGRGQAAGAEAGRVRHTLRLWRIEPVG